MRTEAPGGSGAKVLYCASSWGHLRDFHQPYLTALREAGCDLHIAAKGIPEDCGYPATHTLPFEKRILSLKNFRCVRLLVGLIRRERFSLILVHTSLAAFLCRVALLLSGAKSRPGRGGTRLVYTCHGYFFRADEKGAVRKAPASLAYLACERLMAGATSTLVLMNQTDLASARRYRLSRDIRFCHGMGLDPARYTAPPAPKSPDGRTVFLCVGEFSPRKNQAELLRGLAPLRGRGDWSLWFAGAGAALPGCVRLAEELGLAENVIFHGYVERMSPLYQRADAVVSASRSEGLPFCIMEALHHHVPVVASAIKGHRDLLGGENGGLLYPPGDISALTACLLRLLDRREREKLREKAVLPETRYLPHAMEEFRAVVGGPETDPELL